MNLLSLAGSDESKVDEVCMMLALSVFVLNAPADVVLVPNLQYPCINYFRQCFQDENIQVRTVSIFYNICSLPQLVCNALYFTV